MLIGAFIASLLMGKLSWKEIIENIKKLKVEDVSASIAKVVIGIAVIIITLFVVFRLLKVAFWVVLLGFAISFVKTLIDENKEEDQDD